MPRYYEDWIAAYMDHLDNTESPDIYKRWVAISTVAAALGRKCHVKWHISSNTYPNMYIVLVGPPAIGKGVAMGPAASMLRELGVRLSAQSVTRSALVQDIMSANESELVNGRLEEHSSLTIFSKEFSVFLAHNDPQFLSDLADWYDCEDSWVYKTRGHGDEEIRGLFVNLIGATTPTTLQKTLPEDAFGIGLSSRMVFVYADKKPKIVPIPYLGEHQDEQYKRLCHDLDAISNLRGRFKITRKALEKWTDWYTSKDEEHKFHKIKRLSDYVGRRAAHVLKLMMIVSAARRDELLIDEDAFDAAREYLLHAERFMPQTFRGHGRMKFADLIPQIMEDIATERQIRVSELAARYGNDLDVFDMERLMKTLQMRRYCRIVSDGVSQIVEYIPPEKRE